MREGSWLSLAALVLVLSCASESPPAASSPPSDAPTESEARRRHAELARQSQQGDQKSPRSEPQASEDLRGSPGAQVSHTGTAKVPKMSDDFAAQASAEMERRRAEALQRGKRMQAASEVDAVDEEITQDQVVEQVERRRLQQALMQGALQKSGALATTGCYSQKPELPEDGDVIEHRGLTRDDFRAKEKSKHAKPVVHVPGSEVGAHVGLAIGCVMQTDAQAHAQGGFEAAITDVRYIALLSRENSWWNPKSDEHGRSEWVLRHEQLHFDIAELVAQDWTRRVDETRKLTRGIARSQPEAITNFQINWVAHLATVDDEFKRIEEEYDRETRHGNEYAEQTRWFEKVKRGLAAVRAGLPRTARRSLGESAVGLR